MKKYQIIYADPPWRYRHCASKSRSIEKKYPTMELKDIKNLKIPTSENCLLLLWATSPKLEEALQVMTAWGFDYKSSLVWDKKTMGMGYWFRGQHELLLVGVKGKIKPPKPQQRIKSIWREKRGKHSRKPVRLRKLISEWYPNKSKLEMFARKEKKLFDVDFFRGWDVWGNEVESDIDLITSSKD